MFGHADMEIRDVVVDMNMIFLYLNNIFLRRDKIATTYTFGFCENCNRFAGKRFEILGIAAGGSWITNTMDEFSDIDLVIVVDTNHEREISQERMVIAEKLGNLLSAFTGEHVGEPRLIICLYGPPLLHVDLKFVSLTDFIHRVEDPVILWQRNKILQETIDKGDAVYPLPNLQWIEDRFWVWVHYIATKLARGEIFEAIESISFIRTTILGPLTLMKNGCLPEE
ncbi:MAG: oxalate:formate antiporter [Anaerosporomusa subterranea]|jgi:predicted nucleotidyltransferase|nr:oxalate:formate antiporter [Anaerosporomusa subterranea]